MKDELERIRDWAKEKIQGGNEPPWSWYQHMKLIEAAEAILAGMATTAALPDGAERPERHLRLVGSGDQQETAQRHPTSIPVTLPM
ncbi:hypothetical protein [Dongia deserti]|uniref:hypothetical protein n=1 Tax=Dongia deserti TaxID=2268030 RepID=UPI000E655D0D|nr:hypothetical protein [Dongia deserti]